MLWIKRQSDLRRDVRAEALQFEGTGAACQVTSSWVGIFRKDSEDLLCCLLKPLIQFISAKEIGVLPEFELLSEASDFGVYCLKPQVMDVKEKAP